MSSALIIACIFSSSRRIPFIIVNFFMYVQFYGILLAIAEAILLFVDKYYLKVSVLGAIDIVIVGALYKERIFTEGLVMDVDYAYRIYHYLYGFIKVEKILQRDDAIKAKLINSAYKVTNIEMSDVHTIENPVVQQQPVEEELSYSMYDAEKRQISSDEGDVAMSLPIAGLVTNLFFNKKSNANITESGSIDWLNLSSNTTVITENPLHANLSLNNQSSTLPLIEDANDGEEEENLYQEYQVECAASLSSSADDAYSLKDEEILSFEEWKCNRQEAKKEFKKGTRGSFIRAYQVFEERELLKEESKPAMHSAKHTAQLFGGNSKNPLNTKGNALKETK